MKKTSNSIPLPPLKNLQDQNQMPYHPLLYFKNDLQYKQPKVISLNSGISHVRMKDSQRQKILQNCIDDNIYQDRKGQTEQQNIVQQFWSSKSSSKKIIEMENNAMKGNNSQYYQQFKKIQKTMLKKEYNMQHLSNSSQNKSIRFMQNASNCLLEKQNKLMLLPLCLGLVKMQGQVNILNLNNYNLGDRYIMALGAGLKQVKLIQRCYLGSNRITDLGFSEIVNNISPDILTLDLANNKITKVDKRLLEMIIESEYRLQELNLRNNLLKESSVDAILRNVSYSKHLRKLDLSKNKLTPNCLDSILDMLQKSTSLEELYIACNYLSAKSGEKIFSELSNNTVLKILDYSMNQLGDDESLNCATAIANCFKVNKSLHHLDLSFNNFNKEATGIISEGLSSNHSLYGLHYQGNYGWINSKGFLICEQMQNTLRDSIKQSQIKSYEITKIREGNALQSSRYKHVCWICEGWHEQQFRISVAKSQEKALVYIHFDFQCYEPRLIAVNETVIKYTTMVPPKRYKYYYSMNWIALFDSQHPVQQLVLPEVFKYEMNHEMQELRVERVNVMSGKPYKIVNQWDEIIIKTQPRIVGLCAKKEKEPWSFAKSVWAKQYKLDDQQLLKKCFQRDWTHSKIQNLVKNAADQEIVKQNLWKHYKSIKSIYRYFSSWNPIGDVWAITSQCFTEFCQQSKLINKDLPLKIIDLTFITTNSMSAADWKGNLLVPERGLVRFQFTESLVRLAQQKHKKNGTYDTFGESISTVLKENLENLMPMYDANLWRTTQYFSQFNDELIKRFRPIFNFVYKKNSKLKVKPGEKPFMCLIEFKSIIDRIGLNAYLGQRDMFLNYNQSMMTQVDEVESERYMKMSQIQFIEGLARCAAALPSECTLSPSKPTLYTKLQWLIMKLRMLCNEDLKSQFPDQDSSIFDDKEE